MTPGDIKRIEERLNVTLPPAYRQTLLDGISINGGDPDIYFLQDPKELLIVNLELRSAPRPNAFAGARWPNTLVCIGVDGCGNDYAIDVGDPDGNVLFFDHEADTFETEAKSLQEYFSRLSDRFRWIAARKKLATPTETARVESRISKDAAIARAEVARESVLHPISLEEWSAYVSADSRLRMLNCRIITNPFTGREIRIDWPGLAVTFIDGEEVEFAYALGRIIAHDPSESVLERMRQIAGSLDARVLTNV